MRLIQRIKLRAATLVELLLILIVLGILLYIAAQFYVYVRENAKVSDAISRVNTLVHASYSWLTAMNQKNFCDNVDGSGGCSSNNQISTQKLIDLKLINPQIAENPFVYSNAFVVIMPAESDHRYVTLIYQDVPTTACYKLEQKLQNKVRVINNVPQISCTANASATIFKATF